MSITTVQLPPALQKSLPNLGKFGLWLGVSVVANHLTNSPELAEALATAGVGVANLDGACEVIKGLASGKLSDYYKEFRSSEGFGLNHHLQLALRDGMTNALDELKTTFLAEKPVSEDEQRQIGLYFQSLGHHLGQEITSDGQIDEYARDRAAFFGNLLQTVHTGPTDEAVLMPELSDQTAQRLVAFLVEKLEPVAYRYINEEFKTNDKAKTAYFIHLLESGARINQQNHELLRLLSHALNDVGERQQEHTDLLRHVAQAQQRIYDALRTLTFDFRAYVSDFGYFKKRIHTQLEPSLRINADYRNLDDSFSYQYVQRYTTFISRDAEIDQLWDFLNGQPDRRMLWWLATGPGGMGKSRLALEFCLQARCVNRYVGFVESDQLAGFDWSQWRPAAPTLLVVDYVAAYAEATRKMIAQLSRNAGNNLLTKPVRVLLLERETRDDWWNSFLNDRDVADSSYVAGNPRRVLALLPFTDADRWQIITELHRKQNKPLTARRDETLQHLAEIDPEGRPLFAFLAGMALAEGEDIRHWDVHDLLNNLLEREEDKVWKTHPKWADERCREGHKNLLVLTTLTRGLTVSQLKNLLHKGPDWLPDGKPNPGLYERLSDIRERKLPTGQTETVYEGLQPDIVGEYYGLKWISELLTDDFTGEETIVALLQTAWHLVPEATWGSLSRTVSDFGRFPDARVLDYLVQSRPPANAPETYWEYWGRLQVNLTNHYGTQSEMDKVEERYADLLALSQTYPNNEQIVLCQAEGAYNLTTLYGRQGEMEKAEERYADLKTLTKDHLKNEQVALHQAMGAYNLTNDYGRLGKMEKAEARYADLKTLTKEYLKNEQIVLCQEMGAVNLTTYYSRSGDMTQAEARYTDLLVLNQNYPHNEQIVLHQTMGAGSQLHFASETEKINRKTYFLALLQTLETLLSKYEEHEHWQGNLQLLRQTRDENQWLKS